MTLTVTVRFFTSLREITGKKEEEIQLTRPITVGSLLKQLGKKYGKEYDDYVFDELGDVRGHLQVLVNGQSVTALRGLRTTLRNGDQVAVLPPVGGG